MSEQELRDLKLQVGDEIYVIYIDGAFCEAFIGEIRTDMILFTERVKCSNGSSTTGFYIKKYILPRSVTIIKRMKRSNIIERGNLRVGDVINEGYSDRSVVLEVLESSFLTTFAGDHRKVRNWYTFEQARREGWTIQLPDEEKKPREVTMEAVCEKFGEEVKIIKE